MTCSFLSKNLFTSSNSSSVVLVPLLGVSLSLHGDKIIDDGDKAAAGLCLPLVSLVFTSMVVDGDGDGDGDEDDDDDAGVGGGVDAVDCMVTTLV